MKSLHLFSMLVLAIITTGCGDSIGPSNINVTVISARLSTEHIEARTIDTVYRLDQVQAIFLDNADLSRPFTVDSVIHNGTPLPLVAADSGLYRMEAPSIASIAPGIPIDSVIQPSEVNVTSPAAGAELSLLQGIPISWTPLGDPQGKVMIGIAKGISSNSKIFAYSTVDDGQETIPVRMLSNIPDGEGFIIIYRENSAIRKSEDRNYLIRATSTVATQILFRR
jgi:hypothetical protein